MRPTHFCSRRAGAFLLLLSFLTPCGARAAGGGEVTTLRHGSAHDAFYDVAFEGGEGVAVGAFGAILQTQDAGASWQDHSMAPPGRGLLAVTIRDRHCLAVGPAGVVMAADDCRHWQQQNSGGTARLDGVAVNGTGLAIAVGAFGAVFRSTDWGHHWEALPVDWAAIGKFEGDPHLYAVHVADDGQVTVVGEFELILHSSDRGAHWTAVHRGERSLFALRVRSDGQAFAVGQSGVILRSHDGGATWQETPGGTTNILTGIDALDSDHLLATGINTLRISRDGGAHWHELAPADGRGANQQAVGVPGGRGGSFITVGAAGTIQKISEGAE